MNGGNSNSDENNVVNSNSEELDNSVIVGASGLVSPIKKQKSPKKSRKRQRNEATWFRNEQKRLKNSGQEYQVKKITN